MQDTRLIAIDLDGTLLDSRRRVSPGAVEAIGEAVSAGIEVCLASGRAVNTILPFAAELGLVGPVVSCNGAYILGSDHQVVSHIRLGRDAAERIIGYGEQHGLHTNVDAGDKVYFSTDGPFADLYRGRTGVREDAVLDYCDLLAESPTKILFIDEPQEILRHKDALAHLRGEGHANVVLSEADYIEFLPIGVDKAVGVQAVARSLGLKQSEVAAVGDYHNDLEMVQWAGFGGAVANAVPEVRDAADVVVGSNDEGGAAEFVRAVLRRASRL